MSANGFLRLPVGQGSNSTDVAALAAKKRIILGVATEIITWVPADDVVARHLDLRCGTKVIELDRIILNDKRVSIEWRVACSKAALPTGLKKSCSGR